jgi:hypothetical protein
MTWYDYEDNDDNDATNDKEDEVQEHDVGEHDVGDDTKNEDDEDKEDNAENNTTDLNNTTVNTTNSTANNTTNNTNTEPKYKIVTDTEEIVQMVHIDSNDTVTISVINDPKLEKAKSNNNNSKNNSSINRPRSNSTPSSTKPIITNLSGTTTIEIIDGKIVNVSSNKPQPKYEEVAPVGVDTSKSSTVKFVKKPKKSDPSTTNQATTQTTTTKPISSGSSFPLTQSILAVIFLFAPVCIYLLYQEKRTRQEETKEYDYYRKYDPIDDEVLPRAPAELAEDDDEEISWVSDSDFEQYY